jgi:hypothetical protein
MVLKSEGTAAMRQAGGLARATRVAIARTARTVVGLENMIVSCVEVRFGGIVVGRIVGVLFVTFWLA